MILLKTQISIFIGVMRICLKSSKENQMINSGREWDWMDIKVEDVISGSNSEAIDSNAIED
jgi:hypothetical protein